MDIAVTIAQVGRLKVVWSQLIWALLTMCMLAQSLPKEKII